MKKNGFTLIELLAVIVILGIILLVIMPSITGILNRSQNRLNKEQENAILNAAKDWGTSNLLEDNEKIYLNGIEKKFVTLDELQSSGFLEDKKIQNMTDRGEISKDTKICISYENYQFVYEYDGEC